MNIYNEREPAERSEPTNGRHACQRTAGIFYFARSLKQHRLTNKKNSQSEPNRRTLNLLPPLTGRAWEREGVWSHRLRSYFSDGFKTSRKIMDAILWVVMQSPAPPGWLRGFQMPPICSHHSFLWLGGFDVSWSWNSRVLMSESV